MASRLCELPIRGDLCQWPSPGQFVGTYSVTSFGGVGSTFLLEWLKGLQRAAQLPAASGCPSLLHGRLRHLVSCHINDDGPFKHLADPAVLSAFGPSHRAVYIVGSPTHAVASVFRRRFQCWHFHRLHDCWFSRRQRNGRIPCEAPAVMRLRRVHGEEATTCRVPPVGPLASVEAYAANGADLFGMSDQFQRWLSCNAPRCPFDVLVIRYETLNASLPTLFDFLQMPLAVRALFPFGRLRVANQASSVGGADEASEHLHRVMDSLEAATARIPATGLWLRNARSVAANAQ